MNSLRILLFSIVLANYCLVVELRPRPKAQYPFPPNYPPPPPPLPPPPPRDPRFGYNQQYGYPLSQMPHQPLSYYNGYIPPPGAISQNAMDEELRQMVAYQYQIQMVRQLQQQDMLSQLPEMIKNNQLPPGFDLKQLLSMKDRFSKFNPSNNSNNTGLPGMPELPGLPGLPGLNVSLPGLPEKPKTPLDNLLKNLGGLLTSTLGGLTGMTGAAGMAAGRKPNDVFKMVEDDLMGISNIKGPDEQPLVNPLNSFLNSVGPVLNTVLGLLGLGALG